MDWHAKVLQLRLRADDLNILGNASTAVAAVCILWLIWVAWFSGLGQPMALCLSLLSWENLCAPGAWC